MSFNQLSYHYVYLTIAGEGEVNSWCRESVFDEMALAMMANPVLQRHADFHFRYECF